MTHLLSRFVTVSLFKMRVHICKKYIYYCNIYTNKMIWNTVLYYSFEKYAFLISVDPDP